LFYEKKKMVKGKKQITKGGGGRIGAKRNNENNKGVKKTKTWNEKKG